MDKSAPKVVTEDELNPSPQLQAVIEKMADAKEAMDVANAAVPIEVDLDGKKVKSLNVRLSVSETKRVMSLPPERRAEMATQILKERRVATAIRKEVEREQRKARKALQKRRKVNRQARRKNR